MQQYELSSRDGRIMVRMGRITVPLDGKLRVQLHLPKTITVDDIPRLNMRLRTERHRVDMPNFGIGRDRHKERVSKRLKEMGRMKIELTGLNIEKSVRSKLKKQIQAIEGAGLVVTSVDKASIKMTVTLRHKDAAMIEELLDKVLALDGVEITDTFGIALPE